MVIPIVVLARMGSSRFPGKHMAPLGGQPMIVGIIERMKDIAPVMLATSHGRENDEMCVAATDAGAHVWRGSETNVWERVMSMALAQHYERWVMYLGDCPFVDPSIVADMIAFMAGEDHDRYNITPSVNGIEGVMCYGWTMWGWAKLGGQLHAHPELAEYPWAATQYAGVDEGLLPVSIFRPEQTGVKFSIDYPLELAVANRIVEYIGHWPRSYDQIIAAYKNISSL